MPGLAVLRAALATSLGLLQGRQPPWWHGHSIRRRRLQVCGALVVYFQPPLVDYRDPTAMDWSFTTQSSGGRPRTTFSFSANGVAVPDGGSAVMLLGAALGALGMARRFLKS
jgi:hypothetical protein